MPALKQQKLSYAGASKKTTGLEPVVNETDANVHPSSTGATSSSSSQGDKSTSNNNSSAQDDDTVAVRNDPPPIQYTRCDLKISIKGTTNDNYLKALQQIQTLFTHIKKEDEHATFAPWSSKSVQPILTQPSEIPSEEDDAADYFRGLNPRDDKKGSQQLWFKLNLGHVLDLSEIQRSMNRFMNRRKWTMNKLQLQVERSICVGMLQYSHGNMNFENLASILETAIGIPVQLR